MSTSPPSQVAVSPPPPSIPVQEWRTVQPGVEWQIRQVDTDSITLVRIDPAQVRIRVAYNPRILAGDRPPLTSSDTLHSTQDLLCGQ